MNNVRYETKKRNDIAKGSMVPTTAIAAAPLPPEVGDSLGAIVVVFVVMESVGD